MSTKYRLQKIQDDDVWDMFIRSTEYATIFQYSVYLNALSIRHSRYFIYNSEELRAAIVIVENNEGTRAILDDFIIYYGIVFGSATIKQNRAQIISEQFRINEFIANELPKYYENIKITLTPKTTDIRPFIWVNYGSDLVKYSINIRYTSTIYIRDFADATQLEEISTYNHASQARRQEIRYARRDEVITIENFDPNSFEALYRRTMDRQDLDVANAKLEKMKNLIVSLNNNNILKMFTSMTKGGRIGSMACFALDHNRAYYLLGANEPELRDKHTGTAVLWDAFYELSKDGVTEVDMEGVNSPNRGWFKLSFGGMLQPYYEINWKG